MKVLSLFDGISCGRVALDRAGVQVDKYYASEVDKYAIQVAQKNYPDTVELGDVTKWREWDIEWSEIDLIIGGSPCQGFSFAGKQLAFDDPRSKLFFVYVDILKHIRSVNPQVKFLLENVKMKQEYLDVISDLMGVEPVSINSNLVSAQNRNRYYWANWEFDVPEDLGITWGHVREQNIPWGPMYYSDKAIQWIARHGRRKGKRLRVHQDYENMQMIEASHSKKYSSQRFFGIPDRPASILGRKLVNGVRKDYADVKGVQCLEVREIDKVGTLTTVRKDTVISVLEIGRYPDVFNKLTEGTHYRYITPIECERLQTLPDDYTAGVSNTQRYKALGNGWTVDVIAHIFEALK